MTLLKRRILRIGAVSGAALLAAACAETQLGAQAVKEVARSETRANTGPELAPDAFDATGLTIWDGASTLEGVWIAHPLAQRAQRVRVTNLGDSSVDLTARIWCQAADYWDLKFAMTKGVKEAFDADGISIPYPHTVEIKREG